MSVSMQSAPLASWPIDLVSEFTCAYLSTVSRVEFSPAFGGVYILISPLGNENVSANFIVI